MHCGHRLFVRSRRACRRCKWAPSSTLTAQSLCPYFKERGKGDASGRVRVNFCVEKQASQTMPPPRGRLGFGVELVVVRAHRAPRLEVCFTCRGASFCRGSIGRVLMCCPVLDFSRGRYTFVCVWLRCCTGVQKQRVSGGFFR